MIRLFPEAVLDVQASLEKQPEQQNQHKKLVRTAVQHECNIRLMCIKGLTFILPHYAGDDLAYSV